MKHVHLAVWSHGDDHDMAAFATWTAAAKSIIAMIEASEGRAVDHSPVVESLKGTLIWGEWEYRIVSLPVRQS